MAKIRRNKDPSLILGTGYPAFFFTSWKLAIMLFCHMKTRRKRGFKVVGVLGA